MEWIVDKYYKDNAKKLRTMVDKILLKLKFHDVDKDDFYSLANEVFTRALSTYDHSQDFDGFIYSCLTNKFKTEMTRRNRKKRQADKMALSLNTPIGEDDENTTIGDMMADKSTIETELFEKKEEGYSTKMNKYLSKLSDLQKEVLRLISIGFTPSEILEELHINQRIYEDCYQAIHSYRNISLLF